MGNILEVSGLAKAYPGFSLSDVSFYLPEGCIAGFIGVNGAGKTTTIRTMLGLAGRDGGSVKVFGRDLDAHQLEIRDRIGIVLDEGCFYEGLTIAGMKSIIAPAYSNWSDSDFDNYMERFSLNPRQKIASLSKGMKMKFSLALALSHRADLLIMDEATSGLDPLVRSQFLEIITEYMKNGGKGGIFSTHITSDLDKAADMIILIDKGKIIFEQNKDTLLDSHRVIKGDSTVLSGNVRDLFLNIRQTEYGFTGLTNRLSEVKRHMPDALVERPSIEDIMLGYVKGAKQ